MQEVVRAWLNTVLFFNTLDEIVWTEHFMEFGPDFWGANAYLKRSGVWVWRERLALLLIADFFNFAKQLNKFFHREILGL